jgi:hypothetical protein
VQKELENYCGRLIEQHEDAVSAALRTPEFAAAGAEQWCPLIYLNSPGVTADDRTFSCSISWCLLQSQENVHPLYILCVHAPKRRQYRKLPHGCDYPYLVSDHEC